MFLQRPRCLFIISELWSFPSTNFYCNSRNIASTGTPNISRRLSRYKTDERAADAPRFFKISAAGHEIAPKGTF